MFCQVNSQHTLSPPLVVCVGYSCCPKNATIKVLYCSKLTTSFSQKSSTQKPPDENRWFLCIAESNHSRYNYIRKNPTVQAAGFLRYAPPSKKYVLPEKGHNNYIP